MLFNGRNDNPDFYFMSWNGELKYSHRCSECSGTHEEILSLPDCLKHNNELVIPPVPNNWGTVEVNGVLMVYCQACLEKGVKFKFQSPGTIIQFTPNGHESIERF
jgi:hypothetical protein